MPKGQTLTDKERRYIDAFLGECNGNGTRAAQVAGYRGNDKVLGVASAKLLAKGKIRDAIAARQQARTDASIADAKERDEILTEAMRKHDDWRVRISAIQEANRCAGRHVTRLADADGKPLNFTVVTGVPDP